MARLRQQYANNYSSSSNISAEIEGLVRYINAAELGNKTVAELLRILFNEEGVFTGPVELRLDPGEGLQYRIGEYDRASDGWLNLAPLDELRGAPGMVMSEIGAPIIHSRMDYVSDEGQQEFEYFHTEEDDILVWLDGVLQVPVETYITDPHGGPNDTGSVTFNDPLAAGQLVTFYKIRKTSISGYVRRDTITAAPQAVFPFPHTAETKLQVFLNGILQREGGSADYVADPISNSVVFISSVPPNNTVTIMTVENTDARAVTGLMMEEAFVDLATGMIRLDRIGIDNDAIPQAKVSDLVPALDRRARLTVSSTAPELPDQGSFWYDTSLNPPVLKIHDGTVWQRTSPESALPPYSTSDAGKAVFVDNTGTALTYQNIDLSSVIPVTEKGAASGVATLDSTGRLPRAQLPTVLGSGTLYYADDEPDNGEHEIQRIYRQKIRIDGISIQTSGGSCDVQIAINGVGVGSVYPASVVPNEFALGTPIEVDATGTSEMIGFLVSNEAAAVKLEVALAYTVVST